MRLLRLIFFFGMLSMASNNLFATAIEVIQEASNENKHLFIFLYKDSNERTLRLQKVFDQTMQKLGEQSKSIKIRADDPSEKTIIDRFNLKRSPMPFVLVLAPNGAVTGGFHSFTQEQLADSICSPGAASCLKALQMRKLVLLCLQNTRSANNEAALKGVRDFQADPRFVNATEIVVIDPSNEKEQKFLNQLAIDTHSLQATTVLISPPAEVIATYQGPITKTQLVSDLQKATSGCCGPGGCCPGGKCGSK